MSCSSPTLGLANSPHSPSHCCPRRWLLCQALGASRGSGAVRTPVTAEPICVSSGILFPTPGFGDAALATPPCSTSSSAPFPPWGFHPRRPWDTSACPPVPVPAGNGAVPVQCFLTGEGRFVPASASFPCLSPFIFTPGCSHGMSLEQPRQSSDLALAPCLLLIRQPLLPGLPTAAPSLEKPGHSNLDTVCWCPACGAAWPHPIPWGRGRQDVPPGRNPARSQHLHHFPFLSPWSSLS